MSPLFFQHGLRLLDGTVRIFLAVLLFPLTGIITAAFLTRRLWPKGYGLLVLSATLVGWIELGINSFFARASINFLWEAEDWGFVSLPYFPKTLAFGEVKGNRILQTTSWAWAHGF